ncbi:MAG: DUF2357 domain-containing protein [Anaerolineae bacterium]
MQQRILNPSKSNHATTAVLLPNAGDLVYDLLVFTLDEENPTRFAAEPLTPSADGFVAVMEFSDWLVRERVPSGKEICVKVGEDFIPLYWSNRHRGFQWSFALGAKHPPGGIIHLFQADRHGAFQKLKPSLDVAAGSLLEHEYELLLTRLGQLAVAIESAVTAMVEGTLSEALNTSNPLLDTPNVRQALAVLDFYSTFRTQWSLIEQTPLRGTRRDIQVMRVGTPGVQRIPSATRQLAMHPGRNHLKVLVLAEHLDTPENRFIVFALRKLKEQAEQLHLLLEQKARHLRDKRSQPPIVEKQALKRWREGEAIARKAANELDLVGQRLQEAVHWSQLKLAHPLLEGVKAALPSNPSLALTRSAGYQAVYSGFLSQPSLSEKAQDSISLNYGLRERSVRRPSDLYELWVFLETYALLIDRFGFRPADDGPLAHIEMQLGRIHLERSRSFELELRLANEPTAIYRCRLTYEPPVDYIRCTPQKRCFDGKVCRDLPCFRPYGQHFGNGPDVVLETEHENQRKRFALDAKYRRYATQPLFIDDLRKFRVGTNYETDVLGKAKQQYVDGIGFDAAFVVHSDRDFNFLGETPFSTPPHRESAAGLPTFAAHRYGAVHAVPFDTRELERLLKCLLMYHAGWYDICWTCRKRLRPQPGTGRVGQIYQCEQGHDFWVKSNCSGPEKHTLIKMGWESFHLNKGEWNCSCPACGDTLVDQQKATRKSPSERPLTAFDIFGPPDFG